MNMTKSITLIGVICCFMVEINAQDINGKKSACKPSSCGPEGTKVEEAAIISHLRTEVVTLHKTAQSKSSILNLSLNAVDVKELSGSNDDESIRIMAQFLSRFHNKVLSSIPTNKLNPQVGKLDFEMNDSAARVVSRLMQNVLILQEQLRIL